MSRHGRGPSMGRPSGNPDLPDPGFGDATGVTTHVCFECGGPLAQLAIPCRVCGGKGTLTDAELSLALRRYNNEVILP